MTDVGSDTLIGSLVILSVSSAFLRNMSRLQATQYKTPGKTQIQYINHGEIHALTFSPQKVPDPVISYCPSSGRIRYQPLAT